MDQKNKAELKQQTNQIFNVAEVVVMDYIAKFLNDEPAAVFSDDMPTFVEPFILLPLDDYKKNICLKFNMIPVDPSGSAINAKDQDIISQSIGMNELVKYEKVREGVGFLYYCAKRVYASVIHTCMIDNKSLASTQLELSQENWSFRPQFFHEVSLKKRLLEETLGRIMYMRQNSSEVSAEMLAEANAEHDNVVNTLIALNKEHTADIKDTEAKINADFAGRARLQVFVTELHKNDLPKPITNEADDLAVQNASMPKISGSMYADSN
jgi:hypothetical protein